MASSPAAQTGARELRLFAGESRVIPQRNAARLAVGDGKVVSAAVLDDREILLVANGPGETTLHVWTHGGRSHRVKIVVHSNDMARVTRDLQSFFRDIPNVRTRSIGDNILIEGDNISDADRDRIAEIVKRFPQVIDFTSRVGFDRMFEFDVRFVEISRSGLEDLGIDWTTQGKPLLGFEIAGDLYHNNREGAPVSVALDDGNARSAVNIGTDRLGRFSSRVSVVGSLFGRLNLLAQKGDAVILAQPRLAARNRGTASFLAGGEIPIATASATGTPNINFKEYGIRLEILGPVADDSGTIRARIRTEVSSLDRSVAVMGVPGLLSRRTETEFNLREGETLALSGVISRDQANDVSSVPYVGEIPVLGSLFRSTRFQNRESELVVFLTPRVLQRERAHIDAAAADLEQRAARRLSPPASAPVRPTTPELEPSPGPRFDTFAE
jgi:Flp pilus assembly secretin CpaC